MLKLESSNLDYRINVPTKENEVTKEVLEKLVENVNLPKYYCIIALRYRINIFDLVVTSKSNTSKQKQVSVVPLLAKYNKDEWTIKGDVGDRILIDASDVERGSHLNVSTQITPDKILNYINSDKELIAKAMGRKFGDEVSTIFCLEFKIVPLSSIKGTIVGKIEDPFFESLKGK